MSQSTVASQTTQDGSSPTNLSLRCLWPDWFDGTLSEPSIIINIKKHCRPALQSCHCGMWSGRSSPWDCSSAPKHRFYNLRTRHLFFTTSSGLWIDHAASQQSVGIVWNFRPGGWDYLDQARRPYSEWNGGRRMGIAKMGPGQQDCSTQTPECPYCQTRTTAGPDRRDTRQQHY